MNPTLGAGPNDLELILLLSPRFLDRLDPNTPQTTPGPAPPCLSSRRFFFPWPFFSPSDERWLTTPLSLNSSFARSSLSNAFLLIPTSIFVGILCRFGARPVRRSYSAFWWFLAWAPVNPCAPNLCTSRIVSCTSRTTASQGFRREFSPRFSSLRFVAAPEPSRCRSRLREVDPPTVAKSGKAEGQTTTCTSRFRFWPEREAAACWLFFVDFVMVIIVKKTQWCCESCRGQ